MSSDAPNGLVAHGLDAGYRAKGETRVVVREVSASVAPGELVCLLGVNGAGKSTLLRTLIGDQAPLAGRVTLAGQDIARLSARERARKLAVLLTDRIDVPLMKVEEIVALGRSPHQEWLGTLSEEDRAIVAHAMGRAGATQFAGRFLSELSDGERQRVMLARALAQEPELLILDEPLAFLDLVRRVELMDLLRELADGGLAILLSIHDVELALRAADCMWIIQRDGLFEAGAPEDLAAAGRIAAAFGSDRVRFDHDTGTFIGAGAQPSATARISADGTLGLWARRALERAGFTIAETTADVEVRLDFVDGEQFWRFGANGEDVACVTLGDLVRVARNWLRLRH